MPAARFASLNLISEAEMNLAIFDVELLSLGLFIAFSKVLHSLVSDDLTAETIILTSSF